MAASEKPTAAATPMMTSTWMCVLFIGACIICAHGTLRLWLKLDLPDVAVVRKVDYNEYIEEAYQQFVSFAIAVILHWSCGLAGALPGSWRQTATVFWVGFLQNIIFETALQMTGRRKMDLATFAARAPAAIAALVQALDAVAPALGNVAASSYQALAEGGVYFASFFMYSLWARLAWAGLGATASVRARAAAFAILLPVGGAVFRTYACYANGWPQPIVYGSSAHGKRMMLSTIGFRAPQLVGIGVLLSRAHSRAVWLPLAAVQLPFFLHYFFMLRAMGRSYCESAATNGGGAGGEALPLAADVASNVFRACEPLMGGALVTLVTLAASGELRPPAGKKAKKAPAKRA